MTGLPVAFPGLVEQMVKNPSANAGDIRDLGSIAELGRFLWRRAWQPTPVFLPGESHGRRSVGHYSPWDLKESDTAEQLTLPQETLTLQIPEFGKLTFTR